MFSWLLLSPSQLPEMQGGDKKKGGRKGKMPVPRLSSKNLYILFHCPIEGIILANPHGEETLGSRDQRLQGRMGRLSPCRQPHGGQVLSPALSCRYSLEALGFLLPFAVQHVSLMESKAPTWWASSPRGVPGSLMRSQHRGDGD